MSVIVSPITSRSSRPPVNLLHRQHQYSTIGPIVDLDLPAETPLIWLTNIHISNPLCSNLTALQENATTPDQTYTWPPAPFRFRPNLNHIFLPTANIIPTQYLDNVHIHSSRDLVVHYPCRPSSRMLCT